MSLQIYDILQRDFQSDCFDAMPSDRPLTILLDLSYRLKRLQLQPPARIETEKC